MANWLVKTEPSSYAFEDLVKEGRTAWTGVKNAQAQANLAAMRVGDRVVVYHSGERRAVGLAEVVRAAYADPTSPDGLVCVDLKPVEPLAAPVPLEAMKQELAFAGSALVNQGRLSVVPLSPAEWRAIQELSVVIARTGGLRRAKRF